MAAIATAVLAATLPASADVRKAPGAAQIQEAIALMTPFERLEYEALVRSLEELGPQPDVLRDSFPEQRAMALDPASLKVGFCTRRAAKSFTFGLECVDDSKAWPTGNYLFLGLVREEAKRIFWKDVLKVIDAKYRLGMEFNETSLTATMRNGATIYVGAADANEQEMRKLLGQKYRKIAIDEAQDWHHTDLEDLVFHVLKPACADFHGSISLLGTPGKINRGLFHDVTPLSVQRGIAGERSAGAAGWSVHCWDTSANTAVMADGRTMREHWAQEIAELRAMKPGIDETPWFRRNYRGEKVIEDEKLVYRYQAGRNDFSGTLPIVEGPGRWHFILGIDLGYNDPTAYVLWAYHDSDPNLYGVEAFKRAGMDVTAAANQAKSFTRGRDVEAMVIDGSNKQAVMEMSNRHGLSLIPADKQGKSDFIELMNADYITGRIKLAPTCEALRDEYASLIWNDKAAKREEHPACDNHAADAGLYGWRYCYQYLFKEREKKPVPGSKEWADAQQRALFEKTRRDVQKDRAPSADDWGMGDGGDDDWGTGQAGWS
jgi:hypothetical protein